MIEHLHQCLEARGTQPLVPRAALGDESSQSIDRRHVGQSCPLARSAVKEQDMVDRPRKGADRIAFRQEVPDDLSVGPHMRLIAAPRIKSLDQRPGRRLRREGERKSGSKAIVIEKQDIVRCQPEAGFRQRNRQSGLARTRTSAKKH